MPSENPVIVLAGMSTVPVWLNITALEDTYTVAFLTDRARVVSWLTDQHAALILVDGMDEDWPFWVATPKSSPATRRIPVFVIAEDQAVHQTVLRSGADLVLSPEEFSKQTPELLRDFARVFDPEAAAQLDCACQESLPPLAQQGVEKFNAGEFYKQHDLFEELWMQTDGPERDLYRAILQVGIAYYQILRGNHRGARKMLLRSVQWLSILPDTCQGIDVKALREDSYRVRAELEKLAEEDIDQFDRKLLQPVKMIEA